MLTKQQHFYLFINKKNKKANALSNYKITTTTIKILGDMLLV